jgi:hypothetical protein
MSVADQIRRHKRIRRTIWQVAFALWVVGLLITRGRSIVTVLFLGVVWIGLLLYTASCRCPRCGSRITLQPRLSGHPQAIPRVAQECLSCGLPFTANAGESPKA